MIGKSNSSVIVDLPALHNNFQRLSEFVDKDTRIMAVVKSDAYGHGAIKVAEALEPKVGAFAVNAIQEGIELREAGITKPILVFEVPQKSMVRQYRVHNLTATFSAKEHFDWVPDGTSYHLNFDTGMGRLGFRAEQAEKVAELVNKRKELFCTGIYSHFATAHEPGSARVKEQHRKFNTIRSHFPDQLATHIANTGGTAFYDTEQFNMVRLGIGLYGYAPGDIAIDGLQPVLRWDTFLTQVKEVKKGEAISYGADWQAPGDGYIGILPVGYEDGLKRNLGGKLRVRIGNEDYPVVGTVTMNYSMVFLEQSKFEVGTAVKLLHAGNDAYDWAQKLETIPYEILTSIDLRIPRTYI
jgi:alanine racemase